MKVLLVGGTGVLSTAIMDLSVALGYEVYILNRGNNNRNIPEQVHVFKADIKNPSQVNSLIAGHYFDVVVDFLSFKKNEIENTVSFFKNSCKHYIFISSCAVYNVEDGNVEHNEDSSLVSPSWQYSVDKVECEKVLPLLCEKYNLKYTIIRPNLTYGNTRIPYGVMPPYGYHWTLVARMLNDKPVLLWDDGKNVAHITRVEDFAKGSVALFLNDKAYQQAFHVAGDETYSWMDVVSTLGEILGKDPIVVSVPKEFLAKQMPSRKGEILVGRGLDLILDNSKIKSIIPDFKAEIKLKEGMQKTIKYYLDNNYLKGIDYAFDGTVDRIIYSYYLKNSPKKLKSLNLGFVDYLKSCKFEDRIVYSINKNSGPLMKKVLSRCYSRGLSLFNFCNFSYK